MPCSVVGSVFAQGLPSESGCALQIETSRFRLAFKTRRYVAVIDWQGHGNFNTQLSKAKCNQMMTICNSVWLISGVNLEKWQTPQLLLSALLILPLKWEAGKMVKPTVHMGISTVPPGLPCPRDKCVATWPSCPGRSERSPTSATLEPLAQEMQNRRTTVATAAKNNKRHTTWWMLLTISTTFGNMFCWFYGFVAEILMTGALLLWLSLIPFRSWDNLGSNSGHPFELRPTNLLLFYRISSLCARWNHWCLELNWNCG